MYQLTLESEANNGLGKSGNADTILGHVQNNEHVQRHRLHSPRSVPCTGVTAPTPMDTVLSSEKLSFQEESGRYNDKPGQVLYRENQTDNEGLCKGSHLI